MDYLGGAGFLFKVVEWVARLFASLRRRRKEELEDEILEYIAQNRDWSSANGMWAEKYFKTVKGVPFPPILPAETLGGWAKHKRRCRWFLFQVRHRWRKFFDLVPKGQLADVMRRLWKQGLLERDACGGEPYRLKR
jgi:hypothetical protein